MARRLDSAHESASSREDPEKADLDKIIRVVFGEIDGPPSAVSPEATEPLWDKLRNLGDRLRRPAKKRVGDFLPAL